MQHNSLYCDTIKLKLKGNVKKKICKFKCQNKFNCIKKRAKKT